MEKRDQNQKETLNQKRWIPLEDLFDSEGNFVGKFSKISDDGETAIIRISVPESDETPECDESDKS